jgi:ankyrin repeat protein
MLLQIIFDSAILFGMPVQYASTNNIRQHNALWYACAQDCPKLEMVSSLLEAGMDLNFQNIQGQTPAMAAAVFASRPEVLEFLKSKGADFTLVDNMGMTAAMHASAQSYSLSVITWFCRQGLTNKQRDSIGWTSLMHAYAYNPIRGAAKVLRLYGGDIDQTDNNGRNVLMLASLGTADSVQLQELIDLGSDANAVDAYGKTPLMYSLMNVTEKTKQKVAVLLQSGADIRAEDHSGMTPFLHLTRQGFKIELFNHRSWVYAVRAVSSHLRSNNAGNDHPGLMHEEIFYLLLESVHVHHKDFSGMNALMYAARYLQNERIIKTLLQKGIAINDTDEKGRTALMHALYVNNQNSKVINELLEAGSEVNLKDFEGTTALMYAVQNMDQFEVIKDLIEAGADICAQNNMQQSVIMIAVGKSGNDRVVELLLKSGAAPTTITGENETILMFGVRGNIDCSTMEILLRELDKEFINKQNNEGQTALMLAVKWQKHPAIIELLIQHGADVHITDKNGLNSLMYAAKYCDILSMVKLILGAGVDANSQDNSGKTPLMYAAEINSDEIIINLVVAGAVLGTKDNTGKTAVDWERENGRLK